jgi:nucleotide-binding universal stress UspA family protein
LSGIRRVVVPLDGSSVAVTAIAPGRKLAEALEATLVLMTAEPMILWHEQLDEAQKYLAEQAAQTGYASVETLVAQYQARQQAIVDQGQAADSVVCMATHGRGGLGQAVLGSTAEAVLRASTRPILLVGPHVNAAEIRDGNLVIAIDGSDASEAILPAAADWVHWLGMRPWTVEVLPPPTGTAKERDPAAESTTVRHAARTLLDRDGQEAQWEVLHGEEPAVAVVDFANRLPASLVAVGTHGRTGLARVALGSVAMRVVQDSSCPVLVQRSSSLQRTALPIRS